MDNKDLLLKPFTLNSLSLSGRIVMAPMTRSKSPNNIPGDDVADYYQRRAKNKVGLIITEGTAVEPAGHAYPDVPNFYGEAALQGWKRVVEKVHAVGGKIFPQLWHVGSVRQIGMPPDPSIPGYGPSAVIHPIIEKGQPPKEMSVEDIEDVIDAFAQAAQQAKQMGFDGVEIHGAHGYLVDQFFWRHTNIRADHYGGKRIDERTRFAVELLQAVRHRVGETFPICLRFSQWKLGDYEAQLAKTPQELEIFLKPLVEAGVDIFHCSTRRFYEPEFPNSELNLAGWTKKITGKPAISVGSVGLETDFVSNLLTRKAPNPKGSQRTIDILLERMSREEFDLIAVGRALLADAGWLHKVINGRFKEINTFTADCLKTLF